VEGQAALARALRRRGHDLAAAHGQGARWPEAHLGLPVGGAEAQPDAPVRGERAAVHAHVLGPEGPESELDLTPGEGHARHGGRAEMAGMLGERAGAGPPGAQARSMV